MNILPNEVESVKTIGRLFGDEVKMVKTQGGYYVAVGKKKKTSRKAQALAAGSHNAIVNHQLCKDYGSDFEPALAKSMHEALEKVENKSSYLPREDIEKGIELFTLSKGNQLEFVLYKHGITLGNYRAEAVNNSLVLKSHYFNDVVKSEKKTAEAISKAMKDKMYELSLSKIKKDWL